MTADSNPAPQGGAAPEQKNTLGLVAFVGSLLALCSIGVLSPIPFVMGLFALRNPPRGFAVAGVVIGFLGSIVGAFFGFAVVMGFLYVKEHGGDLKTSMVMIEAAAKIEQERDRKGQFPTDVAGTALIADIADNWSHPLRYKPASDSGGEWFTLTSAGPDGKFGTADDVTEDSRTFLSKTLKVK